MIIDLLAAACFYGILVYSDDAKTTTHTQPFQAPVLEHTDFTLGNIPLIISVPHDGFKKPANIGNRRNGCKVNGVCTFPKRTSKTCKSVCKIVAKSDAGTREIGRQLVEQFEKITGRKPYMVVQTLHRVKLDVNRAELDAAQKDPLAIQAYQEYHKTIQDLRKHFKGPGLVIDLHGQNHKQNKTEIGYLYSPSQLNGRDYSSPSSAEALMQRTGMSPPQLLYGEKSLGALFEELGYQAIPSPRQETPGRDKYYRGGYITQNYGSDKGGQIDAIQIEVQGEIRFASAPEVSQFSHDLARILAKYFTTFYL